MEQKLKQLRQETAGIMTSTSYFMKRAEKYLEQGETEYARACLILMCEKIENYEESLAYFGLTEKWQKHRHLVEGLVKPSLQFHFIQPLQPQECTLQISEIFALPEDELLSALSDHLGELSGSGRFLNSMNKWERTAYYADELWMEVNSGGFDSYLYHHGQHFEKAYHSFEELQASQLLSLLDKIKAKFPRSRVPKSMDSIQNTMERMEEKGIDFDAEDDLFYSSGEREIHACLLQYVLRNRKYFR